MAKKKQTPKQFSEPPITRKEIAEVTVTMYSTFRQMIQGLVPVVKKFSDDMNRIATSLEKIAEYERQKNL